MERNLVGHVIQRDETVTRVPIYDTDCEWITEDEPNEDDMYRLFADHIYRRTEEFSFEFDFERVT